MRAKAEVHNMDKPPLQFLPPDTCEELHVVPNRAHPTLEDAMGRRSDDEYSYCVTGTECPRGTSIQADVL